MNAYYTTNNGYDAIVIPGSGVLFLGFADDDVLTFLTGNNPGFEHWTGDNTCEVADSEEAEIAIAQQFGTIVAQRLSKSAEARFLCLGSKHDELMALMR